MGRKVGVIIPAAGAGERLGGVSKPLIEVDGRPILFRILSLFARLPGVSRICIAVPNSAINRFRRIVETSGFQNITDIVEGGAERPISVRKVFLAIAPGLSDDDLVCIHDAARPLLSEDDLNNVIARAWEHGAAFLASKVKDTLKVVDEFGHSVSTLDRSNIFAAQTPQVMKVGLLKEAYARVPDYSTVTDEIMLLERIKVKALVVAPRHLNFKVTTSEDLELLLKLLS